MLQTGDKVLVCHRDWLPDGRIVKREAEVFDSVKLEDKRIAIGVKVFYDLDRDTGKQDIEGIQYVLDAATDKDPLWLEPWDPDYKEKMAEQIKKDIAEGKVMTEDEWVKKQMSAADKMAKALKKKMKGKAPTKKPDRKKGK